MAQDALRAYAWRDDARHALRPILHGGPPPGRRRRLTPAPAGSLARCPAGGSRPVGAREGDPEEDDRVADGCAGLLGAVLVVLMEQRWPSRSGSGRNTLMRYMHCYILALAAERVSRDTEISVEPPTLANLFDEEQAVRTQRRAPPPSPEGQGGR